jgi:hypothetical protein
MSDHEHDALDALRSLDGPFELADGAEERIENRMLARFDEVAGSSSAHEPSTLVALESARGRVDGSRSSLARVTAKGVAAAAAVVAMVAGLVVVLDRDEPASVSPPAPTTPATTERATLAEQLDEFCRASVVPARAADDGWIPDGSGSETRLNVIISVEQAAEEMLSLDQPLGGRLADVAGRLVDAATEARVATTLSRPNADESVTSALDTLYSAPDAAGVTPLPPSCSP